MTNRIAQRACGDDQTYDGCSNSDLSTQSMGDGTQAMIDKTENQTWRRIVFGIGCVTAVISLASAACSWAAPFSLVSDPRGDLSLHPLEGWVLVAGLLSARATVILGAFAKGKSRVVLIVLGPLLLIGGLLGWL